MKNHFFVTQDEFSEDEECTLSLYCDCKTCRDLQNDEHSSIVSLLSDSSLLFPLAESFSSFSENLLEEVEKAIAATDRDSERGRSEVVPAMKGLLNATARLIVSILKRNAVAETIPHPEISVTEFSSYRRISARDVLHVLHLIVDLCLDGWLFIAIFLGIL